MVKFKFDQTKCILPYDPEELRPTKCLKCLDVCPNSLLIFRPLKEKSEDGAPVKFEIYMTFRSYGNKFCPDCLRCVNICPEKALELKF